MKKIPLLLLYFVLASCHQNAETEEANDLNTADTVSTFAEPKLVKSALLELKVSDAKKAAAEFSKVTRLAGGLVTHQSYRSNETSSVELKRSADSVVTVTAYLPVVHLTAKIPSDSLESFVTALEERSEFTSSVQLHIDDKSLEYLENQLRFNARQKYLKPDRRNKAKGLSDSLATSWEGIQISQKINNKRIDADVQYSTIDVDLLQTPFVRQTVLANTDLTLYKTPFHTQFNDAFNKGLELFLAFIIAVTHLWLFLIVLPLAWFTVKYLKNVRKTKFVAERPFIEKGHS